MKEDDLAQTTVALNEELNEERERRLQASQRALSAVFESAGLRFEMSVLLAANQSLQNENAQLHRNLNQAQQYIAHLQEQQQQQEKR